MTFFTADLHLGHKNILKHTNRPFASVEEMDSVLIANINQVVATNDELYILGDFAWQASNYGKYRNRIKVRKLHIVTGNHDATSLAKYVSTMRDSVYQKIEGHKVHMSHYPHASWHGRTHGSIHLYGHSHGSLESTLDSVWPGRKAMDVGVDNCDLRPLSFTEILNRIS
jgi:calcineurin-like phosphoesterase family protein